MYCPILRVEAVIILQALYFGAGKGLFLNELVIHLFTDSDGAGHRCGDHAAGA